MSKEPTGKTSGLYQRAQELTVVSEKQSVQQHHGLEMQSNRFGIPLSACIFKSLDLMANILEDPVLAQHSGQTAPARWIRRVCVAITCAASWTNWWRGSHPPIVATNGGGPIAQLKFEDATTSYTNFHVPQKESFTKQDSQDIFRDQPLGIGGLW